MWSPGVGGLAFLGMGFGVLLGNLAAGFNNQLYRRIASRQPGGKASPEVRLIPGMLGGVLVPIGLFWFAWYVFRGRFFLEYSTDGDATGLRTPPSISWFPFWQACHSGWACCSSFPPSLLI